MTTLSTHVLDTAHGRPAAGMALALFDEYGTVLFRGVTDGDGRCPDLPSPGPGRYRLEFALADYFRGAGIDLPDPPFFEVVSVAFGIAADGGHYHVPLLASPYAYSTYRGS